MSYDRRLKIDDVDLWQCERCGALVGKAVTSRHDVWHDQLDHEIAEAAGDALDRRLEHRGEAVGTIRTSDEFEARLIAAVREACQQAHAAEPLRFNKLSADARPPYCGEPFPGNPRWRGERCDLVRGHAGPHVFDETDHGA